MKSKAKAGMFAGPSRREVAGSSRHEAVGPNRHEVAGPNRHQAVGQSRHEAVGQSGYEADLMGSPWTRPNVLSTLCGMLFALTVVVGQIVDRTTGQPLTGVDVTVQNAKVAPARTNDAGGYQLRGVTPGRHTLIVSSDDVPPQTFEVVVRNAKSQRFNITACSTTLDYSCASATP